MSRTAPTFQEPIYISLSSVVRDHTRTGLLPRVRASKRRLGQGCRMRGFREPSGVETEHALPGETVFLAATPKRL
jgi:hypothetical protein